MTDIEKKARIFSDATLPARTKLDLTFILCDVINTYMIDAEAILEKNMCSISMDQKKRFKRVIERIKLLKDATSYATELAYKEKDVDTYCEDSDAYSELLYIIQDRVRDANQLEILCQYLKKRYTSKLGLTDK